MSKKQTGRIKKATAIQGARACPHCGYVELVLDPSELQKNLSYNDLL